MRSATSSVLPIVVLITAFALPCHGSSDQSVSVIWSELNPTFDKILSMMDKLTVAPEKSWVPFKDDKESLRRDINKVLDQSIVILGESELMSIVQEIRNTQEQIRTLKKEKSELKTCRVFAPTDSPTWEFWTRDVADYDDAISECEEQIRKAQERLEDLKKQLMAQFEQIGVKLTQDQLEMFINGITRDDDASWIAVFNNVKLITGKIRELSVASNQDVEITKKYFGMHTVLLMTLLRLQEAYVRRIDGVYIPRLQQIVEENQRDMKETEALLRSSDPDLRPRFAANLRTLKLVRRTAHVYEQYLNKNKVRVMNTRAKLYKEYQLALNTFKTVRAAHRLIVLIKQSDDFYQSLASLQIPDLLPLSGTRMAEEFSKITTRLQGSY